MQAEGGLLQKLDKSQDPEPEEPGPGGAGSSWPSSTRATSTAVDWLWGYTTVGINVDKVKAALGSMPMPDNAWDLVFKPEYI